MEHKSDIDDLIKSIVHEDGLDAPSDEFTDKVMGTVMQTNPKMSTYKPLIPKHILAAIISLLLLVILFAFTGGYQLQATKIPYLDKIAGNFRMPHFSIAFPTEISYILTSALIMLLIQVFVIGALYKRMHR